MVKNILKCLEIDVPSDYIDYINVKDIEIDKLPNGVSISTMSASSKIDTEINILVWGSSTWGIEKVTADYKPLDQ